MHACIGTIPQGYELSKAMWRSRLEIADSFQAVREELKAKFQDGTVFQTWHDETAMTTFGLALASLRLTASFPVEDRNNRIITGPR
jgi:hypothetical protein